jgi:hypothetical protein
MNYHEAISYSSITSDACAMEPSSFGREQKISIKPFGGGGVVLRDHHGDFLLGCAIIFLRCAMQSKRGC